MKEQLGDKYSKYVVKETHDESTDATADSQVVSMKDSGADVLLAAPIPKFAAQIIRKAYDISWKPLFLLSNVATSIAATMVPAGPEKGVGVVSSLYTKDQTDPAWATDAGMNEWRAFMRSVHSGWRPDRQQLRLRLFGRADDDASAASVRQRSLAREHHEAGGQHQG